MPAPTANPSPHPTRRKIWPWFVALFGAAGAVGAVGAVVIVACIMVVLAAVALAVWVLILILLTPVSTAPTFIDALEVGDERAAYDLLCEASQDEISLDEFSANFVPNQDVLRTEVEDSGGSLGLPNDTSEVTFFLADGSAAVVTYEADVDPDRYDSILYVCDPPRFPR